MQSQKWRSLSPDCTISNKFVFEIERMMNYNNLKPTTSGQLEPKCWPISTSDMIIWPLSCQMMNEDKTRVHHKCARLPLRFAGKLYHTNGYDEELLKMIQQLIWSLTITTAYQPSHKRMIAHFTPWTKNSSHFSVAPLEPNLRVEWKKGKEPIFQNHSWNNMIVHHQWMSWWEFLKVIARDLVV